MSREYALSRVKDALEKAGGNHLKAQRLLLQWLEKDQTLLAGLVAPHIQGIISHALSHVAHPPKIAGVAKDTAKVDTDAAAGVGEFGRALVSSLRGGNSETFGFGQGTPRDVGKPGKASKAHVDTMNALANAGKTSGKGDGKKK